MNDAVLEKYLLQLHPDEDPPYLTEGIKDLVAKVDRKILKKMIEKFHLALNRNDHNALDDATRKLRNIKRPPKYKEVKEYSENIKGDYPEIEQSSEMAKKVLKNTFKIKDKAKLEILGNAVASAAWAKTKGRSNQMMPETKVILQSIGTRVGSIYDTGMESDESDNDIIRSQMIQRSQRQESIERLVVLVVLAVLVAAFVFAGIVIWSLITSKLVIFITTILVVLALIGKVASFGG